MLEGKLKQVEEEARSMLKGDPKKQEAELREQLKVPRH